MSQAYPSELSMSSQSGAQFPATLNALLSRLAPDWRHGNLRVIAPNGTTRQLRGAGPGPDATIQLINLRALRRLLFSGDIGFAEGYFAGEWDTPDLRALLHAAAVNFDLVPLFRGNALSCLINTFRHWRNRNNEAGSKRNIYAHYDLGNRFYGRWLDTTMTYSAALFEPRDTALDQAQARKYAALAQRVGLQRGHGVLEIGCGWGGFAEFAGGEIGANVTAITISPAQFDHASARIQKAGLGDRVRVLLQDYRAVRGSFDRIVSIEMIEAVGERYWPVYFGKIAECLVPGGQAGIQAITIENTRFARYRARPDFIQRYIFPGGMLPSEQRLAEETAAAGLAWKSIYRFGEHYARTLEIWAENFNGAWGTIAGDGFDERFRRLWNYYLAYCEAGFRAQQIDVVHLALQKL